MKFYLINWVENYAQVKENLVYWKAIAKKKV